MAKKDWKSIAKRLKKQIKSMLPPHSEESIPTDPNRLPVVSAAAYTPNKSAGKPVSPLAPSHFPDLPPIAGVEFAAAAAGIKYQNRKDVMLVRLAAGTQMAGVFTRSSTRSACVRTCQAHLAAPAPAAAGAAILVNSGNSNAFTGAAGDKSVLAITESVAQALGLPQSRVFTSSTGVIGEPLAHDKITAIVPNLVADLRADAMQMAAEAIMTTDTFPKGASASLQVKGGQVHIAGIAKGSGMIAPDMATMLVYIFTDAKIKAPALQKMLSRHVDSTFNSITVDSDTSTSDTLLLAATGQSAAPALTGRDLAAFEAALHKVMLDLAQQVVRDGEGARKFVEIRISGAADAGDAQKVAFAIANSPLVKTAIAGEDPNWGRIVAAVGKSGASAQRDSLTIRFGDILVAEKGWRNPDYTEQDGADYMKNPEIVIAVDLGIGTAKRTVWTCDLTARYVEINADYRS
jgi:glutamate N-acetyltransferase/amino-acid N-acetyltransferase